MRGANPKVAAFPNFFRGLLTSREIAQTPYLLIQIAEYLLRLARIVNATHPAR
jgi:hypothetical protein